MRLGIHALVWVTDWTEESIRYAVGKTAETGYDLIEAVIFDPRDARPDVTAKAVAKAGIGAITGMALNPAADISSPDPAVAKAGEQFISDAILATRDMGSTLLGGVTHSAMHRYGQAAAGGTIDRVTETFARLAARASAAGVRLGIEAVNRYESNVVNTVDDAARIVRTVGSPALFAHIDSYHMNIEEHDFADTIARNVDAIGHVHVGESNRGYLGSGSVDFPEYFRALVRAAYDGPVVFEAFSPAVLKGEVADVLAAWTAHWTDSQDLATKGLRFMRGHIEAATASMNARQPFSRREIR
ncbi:sugar phosphate isomerase/epimerase [Sinorhizobium sp. NFACC03]|uniref:sugar phosphate isomerase/epimerase family protein n=1 Tax=Sinorhizobium sp. NFACC03 TaxID=1566295 RepID=UPI000880A98E|nr:sugar phosphate isomerase/epimerase [Sinorhizobium sp. NFACC03]SDA61809.1 D-psicose/D-tagatose/L-ribulose 3-epimerase [Sinorhizobium sp. NFACC03]